MLNWIFYTLRGMFWLVFIIGAIWLIKVAIEKRQNSEKLK